MREITAKLQLKITTPISSSSSASEPKSASLISGSSDGQVWTQKSGCKRWLWGRIALVRGIVPGKVLSVEGVRLDSGTRTSLSVFGLRLKISEFGSRFDPSTHNLPTLY